MKKLISLSLLLLTACSFSNPPVEEKFIGGGYHIFPDHVDSHNKTIQGADPGTFRFAPGATHSEYAIDKNNAYGFGHKLENADLESFRALTFRYAKDKNTVYWFGDKLESADPKTFVSNESMDPYAKDKAHSYFNGKIIDKEYGDSFTGQAPMVAKNNRNVFCGGQINEKADAKTFHSLSLPNTTEGGLSRYSADAKHVFHDCSYTINDADVNSFQLIDFHFAKDKQYIFQEGRIIKNIDVHSFHGFNSHYIKDKNGVYARNEFERDFAPIPNADLESFEAFNWIVAKDKNHVYRGNKILEGEDPASFSIN